jgi:hypothetical protein
MSAKEQTHSNDTEGAKQRLPKPATENLDILAQQQAPATLIQQARLNPGSLSPRDVLQLQRTIGNRAVGNVIQRVRWSETDPDKRRGSGRGIEGDPYKVPEHEYIVLEGNELDSAVQASNVSGCAGIQISVFSKSSEEAQEQQSATIVFHSDGLEESTTAAQTIVENIIAELPGTQKRVHILVILNLHDYDSTNNHNQVFISLREKLDKKGISHTEKIRKLRRRTTETMDIDLTGDARAVKDRYRSQ